MLVGEDVPLFVHQTADTWHSEGTVHFFLSPLRLDWPLAHPASYPFVLATLSLEAEQRVTISLLSDAKKRSALKVSNSSPITGLEWPRGFHRKLRFPDFKTTAKDSGKVVSLTHRPPLPPGNTPGVHFC